MAWYGQQPTAAELARSEQQKEVALRRKEALERAEAARDPYRQSITEEMASIFKGGIGRR